MHVKSNHTSWVFVVDTEQYAGNFEREMVAFMTGMIGDCGVGEEEAKRFYANLGLNTNWDGVDVQTSCEDFDNPFATSVVSRADDHGVLRPASIWPTPGWFNHGMGGHFRDGDEDSAVQDHQIQCLAYAERKVHPDDQDRHRKRWEDESDKPLRKCPAYLSVAVFFNQKPTDEQIKLMVQRAKTFAAEQGITVTGFRLLTEKTSVEEEASFV